MNIPDSMLEGIYQDIVALIKAESEGEFPEDFFIQHPVTKPIDNEDE